MVDSRSRSKKSVDDNQLTAKQIISLLPITMLAKSRLVIVAYAFVKLRAIFELGCGIPKSCQIRRLLKTKESHNPLYFPGGFIFRLNQLLKKDINFRKCRKKSFYDRVAKGLVHVDSQTVTIQ